MCIREASRAAHRERDAAQEAYQARQHKLAGNSKRRKEHWYTLKDNGIAHEYMAGNLRYAGKTAQGLAVYEFGDGGMNCFHSTLHPAGMEQVLIPDHPEIIEVAAKDKVKGISLKRIEATLAVFSLDPTAFVRSCSPAKPRTLRTIICYTCGGEGHIARQCGNSD